MIPPKLMSWIGISLVLGLFAAASITTVNDRAFAPDLAEPVALFPDDAASAPGALVVHHPGLTSFQERVTLAFADGLRSAGWGCLVAPASSVAPADLSPYGLLVVGTPTYYGQCAPPIADYLGRLGDLAGQRVALIVTAGNSTARLARTMEAAIRDAGGDVVATLELLQFWPNERQRGVKHAEDLARRAGARLGAQP